LKEPRPPPAKMRIPDGARIRELLSSAESLRQVKSPLAVAGIERSQPNLLWPYTYYDLWLHDVFRFAQDDTLIFCATLHNKTGWDLLYRPETLAAGLGTGALPQSGVKANGFVAAGEEAPMFFA